MFHFIPQKIVRKSLVNPFMTGFYMIMAPVIVKKGLI